MIPKASDSSRNSILARSTLSTSTA
ncbi:UNVERIFIED_CONTAM: hypothetical protein GTU68_029082 [Idotea baltica]|nr:hypothetical protein [Idotea baltica]